MKKEELPLLGYDFEFIGGEFHKYIFETINHVNYEIKFKPFFYLFDSDSIYSDTTFEFGIGVLSDKSMKLPPPDVLIPITIATIFIDFFERIGEPVVIYICDTSDEKQLARQRKFDTWFRNFKLSDFVKVDVNLFDNNGNPIPSSLILKLSNPYFLQIIDEFKMIVGGYNTK